MSQAFIGQISMFGGNFAPRNFAFCNGQIMPISQNQALFALIGTFYGGDGRTTFALPNLQSRLPLHMGHGPGLSNYNVGQTGGSVTETITVASMPLHIHTLEATVAPATSTTISSNELPAQATGDSAPLFYVSPQPNVPPPVPHTMDAGACSTTGQGQSHTNLMPSLCISFIICLQGLFPSRN